MAALKGRGCKAYYEPGRIPGGAGRLYWLRERRGHAAGLIPSSSRRPPCSRATLQQFQRRLRSRVIPSSLLPPASTGYTQQFQTPPVQQGHTQQFQTPPAQAGLYPAVPEHHRQGWGQQEGWQQPAPQQQVPDNISFMPGHYVDGNRAYVHVERITQLVSFQACYRIIEFMKNGESVIVNTESIANEAEVIRCIDMLSGAAYTLGCSITKITNIKRAYLISPAHGAGAAMCSSAA